MSQTPSWYALLQCPDCRCSLTEDNVCGSCGWCFPRRGSALDFLARDRPFEALLEGVDGQGMVAGYRKPSPLVSRLRRLISSEYFPGRAWREARSRVVEGPGPILILGSGVSRYERAIHLDIDDFPGVDLIADAHRIPLKDESVEGLICEVVLEHIHDPIRVISECFRVMKPGATCFFLVPFLFPFHGHPGDFRRWSRMGLEQLFDNFGEVEIGIHGGPCSSLVNILSEWAYVLSGQTYPRGYTLIKGGVTGLLFPLKYLDRWVNRFPEAHRLAATFYVSARKPKKAE